MSTTYTLTTPVTVGTMSSPISVAALQITGVAYSSTPALAQIGTGTLQVTLTDPESGWQEQINYADATVLTLWASAQSAAAGTELGDIVAQAVFAKLIADGKLPAGTVGTNPDTAPSSSSAGTGS
jgi:hypothetical protein